MTRRSALVALCSFASFLTLFSESLVAHAAPPTKEECLEAHGKGQDLREKGELADAKRMFILCAQSACPAIVQSDCAKFGEELSRTLPSVSFSARDAKGGDLADTQVYIDDKLVTSRLADGRAYDIDPGKHTIKFVHAGKDTTMNVVISSGEKGRNIVAQFGGDGGQNSGGGGRIVAGGDTASTPSRPVFPLVVAGLGGAALVAGGVLTLIGLGNVPEQCDRSSHQCAAAPGSPVFDDASSAVGMANLGIGLGIGGLVVGVAGLVWYFSSSPSTPDDKRGTGKLVPWADGRGNAGASYHLRF